MGKLFIRVQPSLEAFNCLSDQSLMTERRGGGGGGEGLFKERLNLGCGSSL